LVAGFIVLWQAARYLVRKDQIHKYDALIILMGSLLQRVLQVSAMKRQPQNLIIGSESKGACYAYAHRQGSGFQKHQIII